MSRSSHPQAKFDPIPPNLDLEALVAKTPNFEWALRVSAAKIARLGPQGFEKLVLLHVIHGGKPLVIEKWNDRLPRSLFSAQWLEATYDKREENVRDIGSQTDMRMTVGHYLRSMRQLTDQWTPTNFRDERRQRLYLKDIDCPSEWHDRLQRILPPNVFYMNDNVEERGAQRDEDEFADRSIAPAGDLMSCLPEPMRAQNLMCYVGHEGTYTPAHREMCASLGQNIMIDASGSENGEKPGSSIWFMTETKDREVVAEYFLSMLGHDIEIEKHFAQINAWKKATFPVYIVEQKLGDFILVPPLAPHQVWNRGTRTMKVAWNRTTVETLEMALHEALPKARFVCRDEQYKNKAIIYYALQKYHRDIQNMEKADMDDWLGFGQDLVRNSTRAKQMLQDFKRLFSLFTEILVDEMFGHKEKDVEFIEFDSNITCSYCRANIFNRFLTCKNCVRTLVGGDEDTYDVCMECYVMGRSCQCVSRLSWCEQWDWAELVGNYEAWRTMIITNDGYIDLNSSPLPLEVARRRRGTKSAAQICQEQLRRRPFVDITKPVEPEPLEPEDQELDADGLPLKKKKKKGKKKSDADQYRCHVCCHKHPTYRLAFCSNHGCTEAYCYGTLWRAFDLPPQDVMKVEKWKCPKCLRICNCGQCRRYKVCEPYVPKSTMLGHDTKRISDDRSRENIVDFRVHNLTWLRALGEESRSQDTRRMQKLKQQADAEKAKAGHVKDMVGSGIDNGDAAGGGQQPEANGSSDRLNLTDGEPVGPGNEGSTDRHDEDAGAALVTDGPAAADQADAHGEPEDLSMANGHENGHKESPDVSHSAYPDPSDVAQRERMPGLAYYQQDDTPDKILFDEYEAPSADALAFEDEEHPDFDKKALRAAKRKARLENEDPDFLGPKSRRKRPRVDKDPASLRAMVDPALLDGAGDVSMTGAPNGEGASGGPSGPLHATGYDRPASGENTDISGSNAAPRVDNDKHKWYDANVPELRHARPIVSYAEPDDALEEFNEIVAIKEPAVEGGDDSGKDPLDLAADAIRAMTGQTSEPTPQASTPSLRRRGPGRPRHPRTSGRLAAAVGKPAEPRPRQSRTSLLARQGLDRNATQDDSDPDDADSSDIEAQLAAELDEAEHLPSDVGEDSISPAPPRRRGRPPKNKVFNHHNTPTSAVRSRQSPAAPSSEPKFLSMAERMALKGKKFKMGKSKSGESPQASTPSGTPGTTHASVVLSIEPMLDQARAKALAGVQTGGRSSSATRSSTEDDTGLLASQQHAVAKSPTHNDDNEFVPPQPELSSSQSQTRPTTAPAATRPERPGPTVVRLGDTDEEDEDDFIDSEDDESEEDTGSDDIPARTTGMAFRGKGRPSAPRGRGRPRGGRARRGVGR